jgi:hypothetical protein
MVEGIGQDSIPENVHMKVVDEIINVTDRESFDLSRQLGRVEGIFCGGSTGTNAAAALKIAKDLGPDGVVIFIVCDLGERYLTKHHSDEWMKESATRTAEEDMTLLVKTKTARHPGGLIPPIRLRRSPACCRWSRGCRSAVENGRSVGFRMPRLVVLKIATCSTADPLRTKAFPPSTDSSLSDIVSNCKQSGRRRRGIRRIIGILTRTACSTFPGG